MMRLFLEQNEMIRLDPQFRCSFRSHNHNLAVEVPHSNFSRSKRSFVPSSAHIRNAVPESVPALQKWAHFEKEVNRDLGATNNALVTNNAMLMS